MSKRSHHRPTNMVNVNELAEALNKAGYSQNNAMGGFPGNMGGPQNNANPLSGLLGGGGGNNSNSVANSLSALTGLLGGQGGQMPNMGGGMPGMGGGMPGMGLPQMPMNQGMPQMPQTNGFANNAAPPQSPRPQQTAPPAQPSSTQSTQPAQPTDMEMIKDLFKEILQILKEKE